MDASIQVSDIFYCTVSFKLIDLGFQIFLLFVPEMSTSFTSYMCFVLSTYYLHCFHLDPVTIALAKKIYFTEFLNISNLKEEVYQDISVT
jgi:hypothetical protein